MCMCVGGPGVCVCVCVCVYGRVCCVRSYRTGISTNNMPKGREIRSYLPYKLHLRRHIKIFTLV